MRTIIFALLLSAQASAETTFHTSLTPALSKYAALKTAFENPSTKVYRCSEVAITENASFKNIPNSRKNDFVDKSKGKVNEK